MDYWGGGGGAKGMLAPSQIIKGGSKGYVGPPLKLLGACPPPPPLPLSLPTPMRGWSGGAMVLGKLPVSGRPTLWMIVGQGPIVLAVGAGGCCFDIFTLLFLSLPFLPLSGRRSDIDSNTISKGR